MRISDYSFRELYHKIFVIDVSKRNFAETLFKEADIVQKIDALVVYGYIDHTSGLTFEVLSVFDLDSNSPIIHSAFKTMAFKLRRGSVADCETIQVDIEDTSLFSEKIAHINKNYKHDYVEVTRNVKIIDQFRNANYPDDVMVFLTKDNNQPEGCWVRCEELSTDGLFTGILLNEPDQDFTVHAGDKINFGLAKISDDKMMLVSLC